MGKRLEGGDEIVKAMLRCSHPPEKRGVARADLGGFEVETYTPVPVCWACGSVALYQRVEPRARGGP